MISSIFLDISFLFSCCCFSFLFSFFFHFRSSDLFSNSSSSLKRVFFLYIFPHFCCFSVNPVFPIHYLSVLDLSSSSPCSSSVTCKFLNFYRFFLSSSSLSSFSSSFLFSSFSFLPLLFLLPPFFFISQCDDFLNLPWRFLGAVLPAPALYPSLPPVPPPPPPIILGQFNFISYKIECAIAHRATKEWGTRPLKYTISYSYF